jgi:hypothetical protein
VEEYIEAVSGNGATPVEDLYRSRIIIAGDNHFRTEGVHSVGCDKGITGFYLMRAGCYAVGELTAAFWTGTICGYAHLDGLVGVRLGAVRLGDRSVK